DLQQFFQQQLHSRLISEQKTKERRKRPTPSLRGEGCVPLFFFRIHNSTRKTPCSVMVAVFPLVVKGKIGTFSTKRQQRRDFSGEKSLLCSQQECDDCPHRHGGQSRGGEVAPAGDPPPQRRADGVAGRIAPGNAAGLTQDLLLRHALLGEGV